MKKLIVFLLLSTCCLVHANIPAWTAGNDLTIEGRADSTTTETYSKTDTTTVTAGVKNAYVDAAFAADAVVKAGEDVKRAERALRDAEKRIKNGTLAASALDDYKINLAAASTQLTQATLNLAASGATAAASTGTLGFYATGKAEHIEDAQAIGKPNMLTIDRAGATERRRASLKGVETKAGLDRDEFPPAMFQEGGKGASVRHIKSSDNRGSGACIGAQCRGLPDGSKIKIEVVE